MTSTRILTAYHEAGHVVAAYAQSLYLGSSSIRPEDSALGWSLTEGLSIDVTLDRQQVIVLYSGHAAVRLLEPALDPFAGGAGNDYERAELLLETVGGTRADFERDAAELVSARRAMVEAVAAALLEADEMSGDDLDVLLGAVEAGEDWRTALAQYRALKVAVRSSDA